MFYLIHTRPKNAPCARARGGYIASLSRNFLSPSRNLFEHGHARGICDIPTNNMVTGMSNEPDVTPYLTNPMPHHVQRTPCHITRSAYRHKGDDLFTTAAASMIVLSKTPPRPAETPKNRAVPPEVARKDILRQALTHAFRPWSSCEEVSWIHAALEPTQIARPISSFFALRQRRTDFRLTNNSPTSTRTTTEEVNGHHPWHALSRKRIHRPPPPLTPRLCRCSYGRQTDYRYYNIKRFGGPFT